MKDDISRAIIIRDTCVVLSLIIGSLFWLKVLFYFSSTYTGIMVSTLRNKDYETKSENMQAINIFLWVEAGTASSGLYSPPSSSTSNSRISLNKLFLKGVSSSNFWFSAVCNLLMGQLIALPVWLFMTWICFSIGPVPPSSLAGSAPPNLALARDSKTCLSTFENCDTDDGGGGLDMY